MMTDILVCCVALVALGLLLSFVLALAAVAGCFWFAAKWHDAAHAALRDAMLRQGDREERSGRDYAKMLGHMLRHVAPDQVELVGQYQKNANSRTAEAEQPIRMEPVDTLGETSGGI